MSLKFRIIFVLNILFMNVVLSIDVMNKYGTKYSSTGVVFLDVSGFNSGDKIYITAKTYHICTYTNLYYKFCESTSDYINPSSLSYTYYTSYSSKNTYNSYEEKYNYDIKKPGSEYKYLYLESQCDPPITFENTEDDGGSSTVVIIVAVICSLIALAIIITIIVYCCRWCKRAVYNRVPIPVTPAYGVSPYGVQPVVGVGMVQPITTVQPYGVNANYIPNQNVNQNYNPTYNNQNLNQNYTPNYNNENVQYNSAAPVQQGSEVRINPDVRYEKPH